MTDTTVPQAVAAEVQDQRVAAAMLLGSYLEAGWGPNFGVGDNGTSFGPYQMHQGGALTSSGLTPQQAANVDLATKAMLPAYTDAVNQIPAGLWTTNPEQAAEQAAVLAERPAQSYYASQGTGRVDQAWAATQNALGNPSAYAGGTNAQLTSAFTSGFLGGFLNGLVPGVKTPGDLKTLFERIGLVIFGALLILLGILIVALPPATRAAGTIAGIKTKGATISGSTQRAAKASRDADVARRQGIANRSLAIGEKKVTIQAAKERRLGSNI